MRYYRLAIFDPPIHDKNNKAKDTKVGGHPGFTISSYVKRDPKNPMKYLPGLSTDLFNPAAPDIEFQITLNSPTSFDENGVGGTAITIRGVDIQTVRHAHKFVGKILRLQAGMGVGLPLSNPHQTGTILLGTILSAVGNWVGTEMSLTLYVQNYVSEPGSPDYPVNGWNPLRRQADHLQFNCKKGADMRGAIEKSLVEAAGYYNIDKKYWPNPIPCPRDIAGTYTTFSDLLKGLGNIWQDCFKESLDLRIRGQTITIFPKDHKPPPKQILFEELIGQPTWDEVAKMTFTCPMRGDIGVNDIVELPETFAEVTAQGADAIALPKNRSLLAGRFQVLKISHLGQLRSPDGQQWASTFFCAPA